MRDAPADPAPLAAPGAAPTPPAPQRLTAGPFLRYGDVDKATATWRGSVLFLTSPGEGAPASSAPPTLEIEDADAGGQLAATQPPPALLDSVLGWDFWRFDLSFKLGRSARPVTYRVRHASGAGEAFTFWLAGAGQPFHWGYTSCNGFSGSIPETAPERSDPTYLWRDLLAVHGQFPFHALVGGGDQLYCDGIWKAPSLVAWTAIEDTDVKLAAEWTAEMQDQATRYYLDNYIENFCLEDVATAYATIPGVMVWDDHDIWDGYGSYEPTVQGSAVFKELFTVARRFYLLFQQQTTDAFNSKAREFFGDGELHTLKWLGPQVRLLGIDMRSRRTKAQILPPESYALLRDKLRAVPAEVQHLVVLSGIPVVFPKIPFAETCLSCMAGCIRTSSYIKGMARSTGLMDQFDQPEILDDLVDGWAADVHSDERLQFVRLLKEVALSQRLRVTLVSGDAHVGGVGRIYSHPKVKDVREDPAYMVQIISSAIMNAPPPNPIVKLLVQTNFAEKLDGTMKQKMVRLHLSNRPKLHKLIANRNWCDVAAYLPPLCEPMNPNEPDFGGLRFTLRVEDPLNRRGYAEDVFEVQVPRPPRQGKAAAPVATA